MDWRSLLTDGYGRITEIIERTLKDLTPEDLKWQPRPDSNSIGWLVWHLTRVQDDHIADLMGEEQLYVKDNWAAKFNRPSDPKDRGFGHTPEQVAVFASDAETLIAYHKAVVERSKKFFTTLSDEDLDRELDEPQWNPLPTVGVRLISVLSDNLQHAGQTSYIRGQLQGMGWQKF